MSTERTAEGPPDADLVARVQGGGAAAEEAFRLLMERYERYAYAIAYRLVGRESDARDLVQDSFLRVFRKIGSLREPAKFRGWLAMIISNLSKNWLRGRRDESPLVEGVDAAAAGTPDQDARGLELAEDVRRAIAGLPDLYREAVVLHLIEGQTPTEAAAALGCPAATLRWRLHMARQMLKEKLKSWLA